MGLYSVISWCIFGLIVGAVARFLMPGRQNLGILVTIGLGIVGSFVGGFISSLFSGPGDVHLRASNWIMSIIGALIVLYVYARMQKR